MYGEHGEMTPLVVRKIVVSNQNGQKFERYISKYTIQKKTKTKENESLQSL